MALSPNINIMIKAAEKASKSLLRDFGEVEQLQVSKKGPGDFVSAADHRAEEILHEELSKARPEYGFLMEEQGEIKGQNPDFKWIIDPLDGTSNFLHGIPHWCISIALEEKGRVIAGIIYAPVIDELYRAERGNGAFIRNKRLRVSGRMNLDRAMIATGAPKRAQEEQDQFIREYEAIQAIVPGLRRFGAAALDIAYVAAGRCEAFWERNLNPWDIAAGDIIIREAGGRISDIDTEANPIYTGNVLASNADLYDDLRKTLRSTKKGKDAA
jgi:myo-inositol-1(or 4)-monophosphatase